MVYSRFRLNASLPGPPCPELVGQPSAQSPFAHDRCYLSWRGVSHHVGGHYPSFFALTDSSANGWELTRRAADAVTPDMNQNASKATQASKRLSTARSGATTCCWAALSLINRNTVAGFLACYGVSPSTSCHNSSCAMPPVSRICSRPASSIVRNLGVYARTSRSNSSSSSSDSSTATGLPCRVTTTGPSVEAFTYALNRAFTSATGAIFIAQSPLHQCTAAPALSPLPPECTLLPPRDPPLRTLESGCPAQTVSPTPLQSPPPA